MSGDDDDGGAVEHGVSYARDGVRSAWPGCDQRHADASADASKSLGRMGGSLFVAHQDVAQPVAVVVEAIVDWDRLSARVAEDALRPLRYQCAE